MIHRVYTYAMAKRTTQGFTHIFRQSTYRRNFYIHFTIENKAMTMYANKILKTDFYLSVSVIVQCAWDYYYIKFI